MTFNELPLKPTPQTLGIQLSGVQYRLKVAWNWVAGCWVVDVSDSQGNLLAGGLAVVTGADLLEQFGYLGIGGMLVAQSDQNADDVPTFGNLGVAGHLYYATTP